jgi:hypothetical protein
VWIVEKIQDLLAHFPNRMDLFMVTVKKEGIVSGMCAGPAKETKEIMPIEFGLEIKAWSGNTDEIRTQSRMSPWIEVFAQGNIFKHWFLIIGQIFQLTYDVLSEM